MSEVPPFNNEHLDDHVDDEIAKCLNLRKPNSFFMFAGAGSGKTRSLERALEHIQKKHGDDLRIAGQGVAVITYTIAARDEIDRRVRADPLFNVSTIHSFAWQLISGFNGDIREWLRVDLSKTIQELVAADEKGRQSSQASAIRKAEIQSKTARLVRLDEIRSFKYNPTGDNREKDSLNHAEVIAIAASFLMNKPMMRKILVTGFPFLLIDESQDTNKALVDAVLSVEAEHRKEFCVGFFGDMMQRIYGEGKERFELAIPNEWAKPAKRLNHRCPKRVVRLINQIRREVDDHLQEPRADSSDGHARLFVLMSDTPDKPGTEERIRARMAEIASDPEWTVRNRCKILTLEHHMAAWRMGFQQLFESLSEFGDFRTGLLDGTLPALTFFTENVLPLVKAHHAKDSFKVAKIARDRSPLLSAAALQAAGNGQRQIQLAREAVNHLVVLWTAGVPTCGMVLNAVAEKNLFPVPESLSPFVRLPPDYMPQFTADDGDEEEVSDESSKRLMALAGLLEAPFAEISNYADYLSDASPFDTHQGVKGLEFDRVMVLMDDSDTRGFMFGFDKLFGAKERTAADLKNEREGKDTGIDRTRRLFYVTCSRAKRSLALVAYSKDPAAVRRHVVQNGWFSEEEVSIGRV